MIGEIALSPAAFDELVREMSKHGVVLKMDRLAVRGIDVVEDVNPCRECGQTQRWHMENRPRHFYTPQPEVGTHGKQED